MLFTFILGTVFLAFVRGRADQPFGEAFAIEAGFLVLILHAGFFHHAFDTNYTGFLFYWVLPVVAACFAADRIGRFVGRRRR